MSSGRTPAIRNASPPTALFASWSWWVKPTATGSPVVPEVTCMRTRRSRGAQVGAEGRVPPLAFAQLLLRREGQLGQVSRSAHAFAHAAQPVAVERAGGLEVGELVLERAHARGGSSPAAALSRVAWTV